ncbi:hypothetical protein EDB84DRAFT_1460952 [Lactarius hengduanensis]|nr:hypothetical protein EDB84DRAFT_1460952 [Lactarius hengduanensis]
MFTVKATYRSETRKFTFPDSSFPTYNQIHEQLFRVFPISSSYFLTRLLFTQSPSAPFARILIGMEAHSEEEYEQHVRPFRGREWPDALLRFSVNDDKSPRESQSNGDEDVPMDSPHSFEGRRRSRRHEHHHGRHHGHHRGHHHSDRPEWPRPHSPFIAPPPPPLPPPPPPHHLPPPPPPPLHMFPPFYGPPSSPTPASPPRNSYPFSQPDPPTVDGDTPVQRLFRRRGLRSVASAPVLGPALPAQDAPAMHQYIRKARFSDELDESQDGEVHTSANQSSDKGKQRDACCDVERSKQEVLGLMRVFKADVEREDSKPARPSSPIESEHAKANCGQPTEAEHFAEHSSPPSPVIHLNIICDLCKEMIIGVRHKCLDCPDFDLCSSCLSVQPQDIGFHSRTHAFFAIEEPGGIWAHAIFSGEDTPEPLNQPTNEERTERPNPGPVEEQTPLADNVVVHNATCDLCSSSIIGDRFVKCFDCPDFDVCSSCYAIVPAQHPGHSFARLHDPTDLKLTSVSLPVHRAGCNGCGKVIQGTRYKCMPPGVMEWRVAQFPQSSARLARTYPRRMFRTGTDSGSAEHTSTRDVSCSSYGTHRGYFILIWSFSVRRYSPPTSAPLLPAPSPPPALNGQYTQEQMPARTEPWWEQIAWLPPTPPAPLPVPLRTPSTPQLHFDEYDTAISTAAPTLATAPTVRPESDSGNSQPSLPSRTTNGLQRVIRSCLSVSVTCLNSHLSHLLRMNRRALMILERHSHSRSVLKKTRHCALRSLRITISRMFVKSWRMRNDGPSSWPDETELLVIDKTERFKVGSVSPGEEVDVWTGKYISYWRLCDGKGRRFGHSIWADICVVEQSKAPASDDEGSTSLAASSVVMPNSAPSAPSVPIPPTMNRPRPHFYNEDEEDNEVYEDSRSHFGSTPANGQLLSPDVDYVVLSDDGSDL